MPEYPQVTDISSHSNYPNSWSDLFAKEDGKEYVLIAGPGIAEWPCIENDQYASCYLARLLDGMIKWCVQENIIDQSDTIEDFHRLLQGKSLVHVGYKIEEYLVDRPQLRQCLQEVLHHQTRLWEMHRCLARLPFRGYITTTYDTFIETAYSQIKQSRLSKFYTSSIHDAIEAYRNDFPFILKLYGDIDNPDSLILARRLTNGLSVIGEQDQLHTLLSMSSVLFVGFEKTDPDFEVLSSIVKGTYVSREDFISWMISNDQPHKLQWESKSGAIISYQPSQIDAAVPVLSKTLLPPKTIESDLRTEQTSRNKPSQQMRRAPAPSTAEDARPIEVFTAYAYSDEESKKRIDYILSTLS
jgi:SIR2-like domain